MRHVRLIAAALVLAALVAAADGAALARPIARRGHTVARYSIVGGTAAEGPGFAALARLEDHRGAVVGECTGVVIAPTVVLTTAHCTESLANGATNPAGGYSVFTGAATGDPPAQRTAVANVIPDRNFPIGPSPLDGTNDAGLLILATPVSAAPLALGAGNGMPRPGRRGVAVGWGLVSLDPPRSPSRLRRADLQVMGAAWCARHAALFHSSTEFCALDAARHATVCDGDSGGPLLMLHGAVPVAVGIVSRSSIACSPQKPVVFTRVSAILPWVRSTLARLGDPLPATVP